MEWRLFAEGETPWVSTAEFHADRERAPHLEQPVHRPRLEKAAEFVVIASAEMYPLTGDAAAWTPGTVSDLGCGDGGLLSLLSNFMGIEAWGYDFQPSNAAGWRERGVAARTLDAFGAGRAQVIPGDISVCTEVLEHLADPHEVVRWIAQVSTYLVASSPWTESDQSHDACHAWAWDMDGYRALLEENGFQVLRHEKVGMFQVILGYAG